MLHEVELLEELPYYRSLARPRPPLQHQAAPGFDETPIAIIAPDIRTPSKQQQQHHTANSLPQQYSGPGCPEVLVSVAAYGADVATDLALCCALFAEGRVVWSALIVTFVLLSAVVVNACSLYWYIRSQKSATAVYTSVGKVQWGIRVVAHALLLGLLYRYLYQLCSSCLCKSQHYHQAEDNRDHHRGSVMEARKRKNALRRAAIREDRQAAVLGLLHSLLESAPQLILQLYTMAQRTDADSLVIVFMQGTCALSSLFQTTWSITSYNSTLHRTTAGKKTLSGAGKLLQFLWHFCTVGSRACTLALFAREYHFWLFPFCIGHWGVMTVWVMHQQTRLCRKASNGQLRQCREYAGNMVIGIAYVIYYLNVKAEPTRYKYSAYYAVVFAENCVLMTLWFLKNDPGAWYHIPALVAVFSSFTSGVVFMLFYYGFCHRTLKHKNEKPRCC